MVRNRISRGNSLSKGQTWTPSALICLSITEWLVRVTCLAFSTLTNPASRSFFIKNLAYCYINYDTAKSTRTRVAFRAWRGRGRKAALLEQVEHCRTPGLFSGRQPFERLWTPVKLTGLVNRTLSTQADH